MHKNESIQNKKSQTNKQQNITKTKTKTTRGPYATQHTDTAAVTDKVDPGIVVNYIMYTGYD